MNLFVQYAIFSIKKVPGYDPETRPYVFIKDESHVSMLNTKTMKILPLVRSPYKMTNAINMHNMEIMPCYDKENYNGPINIVNYN